MRVCIYTDNRSASGFYRGHLIASHLNYHITNTIDDILVNFTDFDAVLIQRKFTTRDLEVIKQLQAKGLKVFYDLDDDIFNVPHWNPTYSYFNRQRATIAKILRQVDKIVVSTPQLEKQVKFLNPNTRIAPNLIDLEIVKNSNPINLQLKDKNLQNTPNGILTDPNRIRIGWAGSPTHKEDLKLVTNSLIRLAREHRNVNIIMVLCADHRLIKAVDYSQLFFVEAVPFDNYYGMLKSLDLDIGLAPLKMDVFNKSKSNLKVLEYMSLGITPLATSIENYKRTLSKYNNNLLISSNLQWGWYKALKELITTIKFRDRVNLQSFIRDNYNIVNKKNTWRKALEL